MKYLAYMNILFEDNHVQTGEIGKRGDALRYYPGITNLIKKLPVD